MAEREKINFRPTEEDWALIEEQMAFHGDDEPGAIRRGLRAGHRELEILKAAHRNAASSVARNTPKTKSNASRK